MIYLLTMSNYFENLRNDFAALGLCTPGESPRTYAGALALLKVTGHTPQHRVPATFSAQTSLGKRMASHIGRETFFQNKSRYRDFPGCIYSETRLLAALQDGFIADESKPSPVVIIDSQGPLAITKSIGDPTTYVLRDSEKYHAIGRTFSFCNELLDPKVLERRAGAYIMHIADAGPLIPIRYSAFALPATARQDLVSHPDIAGLLACSADDIVTEVQAIAATSTEHLSSKQVRRAQAETELAYLINN